MVAQEKAAKAKAEHENAVSGLNDIEGVVP
jgi:hypothetical protein